MGIRKEKPRVKFVPYVFESVYGDRVDAELGNFQVRENRRVENGRKIHLSLVRFPSTNPNPGPPIVYLAGWPGGSEIEAARLPISLAPETAVRYLGEYQAENEVWRVISLGTYRFFHGEGRITEDMRIQIRYGGNGYSLLPVSDTEFFIPLPGCEAITYTVVADENGQVTRLAYRSRQGPMAVLPKLK